MSLSTALNIAQSALQATSRQTSIVSQNIASANDPDYARRVAQVTSTAPGARVVTIQRAASDTLFRQNLIAVSSREAQSTLYSGAERLGTAVNGVDNATSAATALANLQKALDTYASTPSNRNLAENAVTAAKQAVRALNDGTNAIQDFRVQTDADISSAVGELNQLLSDFEGINKSIVSATAAGRDTSDLMDKRDAALKKISEYVPISTFTRTNNDTVIMAGNGSTLFETVARKVTFEPLAGYSPGADGNSIYVDGVPIIGGVGANTDASGKLAGMVQLRDSVSATMQSQLDEVARGLITAFSESDPNGVLADRPGLFTWPGAPAIPAAGTLVDGLAGQIRINAAMDSSQGGNPELLRDGGANGAAYVSNTSGASYSGLILKYGERMNTSMAFDASAQNGNSSSLMAYATNSIGWFEGVRKEASEAIQTKDALATRTETALSNQTGVNVDTEMALLLDLENSYTASARIMKAVDDMFTSLLSAVN
jgi:flagellar hook-associated protein 1